MNDIDKSDLMSTEAEDLTAFRGKNRNRFLSFLVYAVALLLYAFIFAATIELKIHIMGKQSKSPGYVLVYLGALAVWVLIPLYNQLFLKERLSKPGRLFINLLMFLLIVGAWVG